MLSLRSQYLNALNIPEYLHVTKDKSGPSARLIDIKCLVVEAESSSSVCHSGAAQVFLYKMLSAIGLHEKEVICIQANADNFLQKVSKYSAQVTLLTDAQFKPTTGEAFNIHHPSDILKHEALKREAWEVLKQVQACLK